MTIKIRGKHQKLKVDQLQPNPWNPNVLTDFMRDKLRVSLEQHGFTVPVVVRKLKKDQYQIIDGQHRFEVAKEVGMEEVPCLVLDKVTDAEAKILCETFIHLHGEPDIVKEAELIRSLVSDDGVDLSTLAESLPLTEDQVQSLHDCLDFDWSQYGQPAAVTGATPTAATSAGEEGQTPSAGGGETGGGATVGATVGATTATAPVAAHKVKASVVLGAYLPVGASPDEEHALREFIAIVRDAVATLNKNAPAVETTVQVRPTGWGE